MAPPGRSLLALALVIGCGGRDADVDVGAARAPLKLPKDMITPTSPAGRLVGSSSVSATGAFQYALDLWVPRGRAGMQPEVALHYSSKGGNGSLGVGWQLRAAGAISRCNKAMEPDTAVDNPRFDPDDAYCLNGARLVPVADAPLDERVIDNPTGVSLWKEFRTENESFARVLAFGVIDPTSWVVLRKSGRIEYYGESGMAKTHAVRFGTSNVVTLAWHLERVTDRSGNEIHYSWAQDDSGSAARILAGIRYTVSDSGQYATTVQRQVLFRYQPRPDPVDRWVNGLHVRLESRLESIEMIAPNPTSPTVVRTYKLVYDESRRSSRSLLTSVAECDALDVCVAPTTFEYGQPTPAWDPVTYWDNAGQAIADEFPTYWWTALQVTDLDSDGRDDVLYDTWWGAVSGDNVRVWTKPRFRLANGLLTSSFGGPVLLDEHFDQENPFDDTDGVYYPRWVGGATAGSFDLDGDGAREWAALVTDDNQRKLRFFEWRADLGTLAPLSRDLDCPTENCGYTFLDFEGDAVGDVVEQAFDANGSKLRFHSNVEGRYFVDDRYSSITLGPEYVSTAVADLDGNGSADLMARRDDEKFMAISQRNGSVSLTGPGNYLEWSTLADINGDGLKDLVYPFSHPQTVGAPVPQVMYNTGNGFGPLQDTPSLDWSQVPTDDGAFDDVARRKGFRALVADFNGDGRDDILILRSLFSESETQDLLAEYQQYPYGFVAIYDVWFSNELHALLLSTGDGFMLQPIEGPERMVYHPMAKWGSTQLGDVDGDGRIDIVSMTASDEISLCEDGGFATCYSGFRLVVSRQRDTAVAHDTLIRVTDGIGGDEQVLYHWGRPDDDEVEPVYQAPTSGCAWPDRCVTKLGPVVKRHAKGPRKWTYRYARGRANLTGRGFLGFETVTVTDDATGAVTERHYDLERKPGYREFYALAGLPVRTATRVTDDQGWVHETEVTTDYTISHSGERYRVTPHETRTRVLVNGAVKRETVTTTWYDKYDNLYDSKAVTGGATEQTVTQFDNDPTTWLLGQATRVEVTSTASGDSDTRTTAMSYDSRGLLETMTVEPDSPGSPSLWLKATMFRDDAGQPFAVEREDAEGSSRVSKVFYDSDGVFPIRFVNAEMHEVEVLVHPAVGRAGLVSDPNGLITAMTYDGVGRLTGVDHPDDRLETIAYSDLLGPYTVTASSNAGTWHQSVYDTRMMLTRELRSSSRGTPVVVDYGYDAADRLINESQPRFEGESPTYVAARFDNLGRRLEIKQPDGASDTWTYPDFGQVRHVDPVGRSSIQDVSADGLVHEIIRSENGVARTSRVVFGPFGLPASVRGPLATLDPMARGLTMQYDRLGRRTGLYDPNTGFIATGYNAFGEPVVEEPANGATRRMVYDKIGRLRQRTTEDGVDQYTWDVGYKALGRLTSAVSSDGVAWSAAYNHLSLLSTERYSFESRSWSFDFKYDGFSRMFETIYPVTLDGTALRIRTTYDHDAVAKIVDQTTGVDLYEVSRRDARERIVQSKRGGGAYNLVRTFDPATARLLNLDVEGLDPTPVVRRRYEYHDDGRISSRTDLVAGIVEGFEYDDLGRLSRWDANRSGEQRSRRYDHDIAGRLSKVSDYSIEGTFQVLLGEQEYVYPAIGQAMPHAPTRAGEHRLVHDIMGREIERRDAADHLEREVRYTWRNLPRSGAHLGRTFQADYDPFGGRFRKLSEFGERFFVGDLYEVKPGETERFNVFGPEGQIAVLTYSGGGTFDATYTFADERDATVATGHQGGRVEHYFYEPFGRRVDAAGKSLEPQPSLEPIAGYSGHVYDDDLGLIHMRGRAYDPVTRKFLSPDPILDNFAAGRGIDRFGLVGFDPVNRVDPTGFQGFTIADDGTYLMPAITIVGDPDRLSDSEMAAAWQDIVNTYGGPSVSSGTVGYDFSPSNLANYPQEPELPFVTRHSCELVSCHRGVDEGHIGAGAYPEFTLEMVQNGLDGLSLVAESTFVGEPVALAADGLNLIISVAIGDWVGAGMSVGAAIPGIGASANLARIARGADRGLVPLAKRTGLDWSIVSKGTAGTAAELGERGAIQVTRQGVALPRGARYKIPDHFVENPHRAGSYGEVVDGRFVERLRIDPATPPGAKGPNHSHYHLDGKPRHYSPRPGDPDPGFPQ